MHFKLRPLAENDRDFVIGLYQNPSIMRHIGSVLTDKQSTGLVDKMLDEVATKKALYGLIETAESTVSAGLLSMHWKTQDQVIESGMIVATEFQGQGLCQWAQMAALKWAKNIYPVKTCSVYIESANVAANKSYKKMGFERVENKSKLNRHLGLQRWDFNMELLRE